MKYCSACGHKNESINGSPPKFCSNCGEPLSGGSKIEAEEKVEKDVNPEGKIPEVKAEELFEISQGSDFASFTFGEIAKGESKSNLSNRPSKSMDQIWNRVKKDNFDAEK